MFAKSDYAYLAYPAQARAFDMFLFVCLVALFAIILVYTFKRRKFFDEGIPMALFGVVVLKNFVVKNSYIGLYIDLIILAIGLTVWWFNHKKSQKPN